MIDTITKTHTLKQDIELLERSSVFQKEDLVRGLHQKIESLKPRNLVKASLNNFQSKPSLNKGVILTAAGLVSFLFVKRLVKKNKKSGILKLLISTVGTIVVRKALTRFKNTNQAKLVNELHG